MIKKYKKKPIVIKAAQYTGNNKQEIIKFTNGSARTNTSCSYLIIPTLEGNHKANVTDWIIKGVENEFYPCKDNIFKKTYIEVKEKN